MLNESQFHLLADTTLERLAEVLETADEAGECEIDLLSGILTLELPTGQHYVISKHAPSQQIWLSSPISGGLHFSYNPEDDSWRLPDGQALQPLLARELETLIGLRL